MGETILDKYAELVGLTNQEQDPINRFKQIVNQVEGTIIYTDDVVDNTSSKE